MTAQNSSTSRLKPLDEKDMSDAQRKVYREIASGPRGGVRGPFNALLRSPELADRAQKLGEYVRFNASLPDPLKEFAILITARHWTAQYEWHAHHAHAMKAGLASAIAADLAEGRRPEGMDGDAAAVYDFCRELHETKAVGDAAYAAVVEKFGERGVVDLIAILGYYTLVSMVLNVERRPIPGGGALPLRRLA
jgi:4-carboxymuconolactone decarboxylase